MPFTPTYLLPTLFWDTDFAAMGWEKNKRLIIQRVIERGTYKALQEIISRYGLVELRCVIKDLPFMSAKDRSFVCIYFDIPETELKCSTKKLSIANYLS